MTTQKNPLRKLATLIHTACKQGGLKQTVILKALSDHSGFHSIQCGDKSTLPKETENQDQKSINFPEHVFLYLKGLVCDILCESNSYDFFSEGQKEASVALTGDSLTTAIIKELKDNPIEFIYNVKKYDDIIYELMDSVKSSIKSKDKTEVESHFGDKGLPKSISDALVNDIVDGADLSDDFDTWLNSVYRLTACQASDFEKITVAIHESPTAQRAVEENVDTLSITKVEE